MNGGIGDPYTSINSPAYSSDYGEIWRRIQNHAHYRVAHSPACTDATGLHPTSKFTLGNTSSAPHLIEIMAE